MGIFRGWIEDHERRQDEAGEPHEKTPSDLAAEAIERTEQQTPPPAKNIEENKPEDPQGDLFVHEPSEKYPD